MPNHNPRCTHQPWGPQQATTDEHFRFHAYSTLGVCLERVRHQQQAAAQAPAAAGDSATSAEAATAEAALPLLDATFQRQLLQLLWQGFEVRGRGLQQGAACRCASCAPRAGLPPTRRISVPPAPLLLCRRH